MLEDKLAKNELTERDSLNYAILNLILWTSIPYLSYKEELDWYIFFELIGTLVIIYFGLRKCYEINNLIDGKNFTLRLFPIILVMSIRFTVYLGFIYLLLFLILISNYQNLKIADLTSNTWIRPILLILSQGIFYYLIYKSFTRIKENTSYDIVS